MIMFFYHLFRINIMEKIKFTPFNLLGTTKLHTDLEELVARFVGKQAAILFGMGYVTNSAIIPCLIGKVCSNA
jgi:7-keto-8-aminopelargonate synthetase-like enzyme